MSYWTGATDAATTPSYYAYTADGASDFHIEQFTHVTAWLRTMALVRDGNGRPVLQIVFDRPCHTCPVIAFRFTSDWANDRYGDELASLGGSLERGMWNPFARGENYVFDKFVR